MVDAYTSLPNMEKKAIKRYMRNGQILTYQELQNIRSSENLESLVDARTYDLTIVTQYEKFDMFPYTGECIFVRDTVAKKLSTANNILSKNRYRLKIVYGYRHPEIQNLYFQKRKTILQRKNPLLPKAALDALTHNFVAVPSVAGHPTGGAIDITIIDSSGNNLDMGTSIADFTLSEKIQTFSPNLTEIQKSNRKLLHDTLLQEGFAPFYGEWWHFSYGDREWACFYDIPTSLYSSIDFKISS